MNKKFLSVALFGALMATSIGTFTSCKDYDDDINGLQEQVDKSGSAISALQSQLTTLQTASEAAKSTADAAKKAADEARIAADAAKAAGDAAAADAATAKVKAEEAIAAAAKAKADAIDAAKKEVADLKTIMENALASKVNLTDFNAAIEAVNAKINGIQADLGTLQNTVEGIDGKVVENANAIESAQDAITNLIAANVDLDTQLKALKEYAEATQDLATDNKEAIETAQGDIEAAQADIQKLWDQLTADKKELKGLIDANTSSVELLTQDLKATNASIETLKGDIEDKLDAVKKDIKGIQADIVDINNKIIAIEGNLASLHTLIVCRLTAITFAPDAFVGGVEAIIFNTLKYANIPANENSAIPTNYKLSSAALATASYHFNPASFKLKNADYGFIDRTAEIRGTRAAASKWVEIKGEPVLNVASGTVDFQLLRLNAHSTQPGSSQANIIALQATLKGDAIDAGESGAVVTSPYVRIEDDFLTADHVRISDKATLSTGNVAHYPITFDEAKVDKVWYIDMAYDKIFNLKEKVETCLANGIHTAFDIDAYNLKYKFSVATSAFNITSGNTTTNQQKWIECTDAKEGLFKATDFSKEAIGRTPILKVELVDASDNVVRRAFVKVQIGVDKSNDLTVGTSHDLVFLCNSTSATYELNEDYIRENVYRVITNGKETSLSHEEFWNMYEFEKSGVMKNGQAIGITAPAVVDGDTGTGTATKKIVWKFTHGQIGSVGSGAQLVGSVTVKNKLVSSEFPAHVTFKFTVNVTLPTYTLAKTENDIYWQKDGDKHLAFKVNVQVPNTQTSPASECLFNTSLPTAYSKYEVGFKPSNTCTENYFKVVKTFDNGVATSIVMSGVYVNNLDICLKKNNAAVEKALNSAKGLQAQVQHIYKLENGDELVVNEFLVNFIRPVNLNMPSGVTVVDAKTGGDIADFQWNGLLTDWRNEAIVASTWSWVDKVRSYWKRVCTPEFEYVDGHYVEITPAKLNVEYGEVSFVATTEVTMYTGEVVYEQQKRVAILGWVHDKNVTFEITDKKLSKSEVEAGLDAKLAAYKQTLDSNHRIANRVGNITYVESKVSQGQTIEYTYVKSIDYVPAVYEWVDGKYEMKPHVHTGRPTHEGSTYGETSGCWEWTKVSWTQPNWNAGQYWNFYGNFSNIVADVSKATTSLTYNGGKLPADATLVQVGNTVKYENVGAPIGYSFEIYIPATVTYGWGTTSSQLTITVNPVK